MLLLCFLLLSVVIFSVMFYGAKSAHVATVTEVRLQSVIVPMVKPSVKPTAYELEKRQPGRFYWLEQRLENSSLLVQCQRLLAQSKSTWSAGGVFVASFCLGALLPALVFVLTGNVVVAIATSVCAFLPVMWLRAKRERRIARFEAALPQSLEMFSRSLRAGHAVPVAVGTLAEEAPETVRAEFADLHRDQNFGLPIREALQAMMERTPSRDLRIFVTGLLVQKDSGGNLPEVVDRTAAVLRDRVRIQGEVRTHTAQGRLTGWILCLLPLFLLLTINLMNPGYSRLLLNDPMGRRLLYAGLVLLTLGVVTIRHIIRGIEV